jgi:hypothetical protein
MMSDIDEAYNQIRYWLDIARCDLITTPYFQHHPELKEQEKWDSRQWSAQLRFLVC